MAGFRNTTFDDTDTTHLIYSPGGFWNHGTWNASSTGQSGTLSTSNVLLDANVTFTFPEPAIGFYYYGIQRSHGAVYGICVDCDQNALSFQTIDAVNTTDDGRNPPVLLYAVHFDTPGVHRIILQNQPDTRFPNNNSQIDIDRFELEVVDPNAPSTLTVTASDASASSISQPTSPPSTSPSSIPSSTSKNIGAILGGVLGGSALVLIALAVWFLFWRRNRFRRNTINHDGFDPAPGAPRPSPAAVQDSMSEIPTTSAMAAAAAKGRHTYSMQRTHHVAGPSFGSSGWTTPTTSSGFHHTESSRRGELSPGLMSVSGNDAPPPDYDQLFRRHSQSQSSSSGRAVGRSPILPNVKQ
ncbi:hypothetical protein NP233_g675 [Leucocoprinus birnbaumii]|uniref:Uncharacterized protein n=1 Tax=Leucocoprinus birnbaumii TaxID=56174 RepID=A0AAD5W571_9AGAR|nr:hypothetical protein NP233_g675 [Leucocoprinus birnbaumii]